MSGPIVGRAQTLDDSVRTGAKVFCAVCNKTDKLSRCSRCKVVFYCTKEHQRRDWKRHREFCATHPAATASTEEPFSAVAVAVAANESSDREIPSKRHPSVNDRTASNTLVTNLDLNKTLPSDAPWGSNVTSDPCRNVKHLAGMARARARARARAYFASRRCQTRILRSSSILRGNGNGNLVADNL